MPVPRSERDQLGRRDFAGSVAKLAGVGVGEAGVELEPGERADFGAGGVARVGDAAQAVEDRVVGVEAPGHLAEAGGREAGSSGRRGRCRGRPGSVVEGGACRARIAAALEVEAAVQDAVADDPPSGEDGGRDARFRPEAGEGSRRREQLHVGGERSARAGGRAGANRPPTAGVDHEQAARPARRRARAGRAERWQNFPPPAAFTARGGQKGAAKSRNVTNRQGVRLIYWDNPCLWAKLWT